MRQHNGFALVELLVVLGITVMITAIALASFPQIKNRIVVTKEARTLALSLRKAQAYAIAVRQFGQEPAFKNDPFCNPTNAPVEFPPYGVSLSAVSQPAPDVRSNNTYVIFGDINCDKAYDVASSWPETIETISIQDRAYISVIFGYNSNCAPCRLDSLDVIYQRPTPSEILIGKVTADGSVQYFYGAYMVIKAADNNTSRKIVIRTTGQISVE